MGTGFTGFITVKLSFLVPDAFSGISGTRVKG